MRTRCLIALVFTHALHGDGIAALPPIGQALRMTLVRMVAASCPWA